MRFSVILFIIYSLIALKPQIACATKCKNYLLKAGSKEEIMSKAATLNVDLRSDTVTQPSSEMRLIIGNAVVGDDGYNEDPSINELEAYSATLFGKEAAVFMPSGTMGNQAAIMAQTSFGDVIVTPKGTHISTTERESTELLSRVNIIEIGANGIFSIENLQAILSQPSDVRPSLVTIENTVNFGGGSIFPFEEISEISDYARKNGIKLHLDGARIFNASISTGIPVSTWAKPFDTVMFCLSKGLGAPAGSVVVGTHETIVRIRKYRKILGGRMRQGGHFAAAGLFALQNNIGDMARDHENARLLAEGLIKQGYKVKVFPQTNIVIFETESREPNQFVDLLKGHGVLVNHFGSGRMRAVTHRDITREQIEYVLRQSGEISFA